METKEKKIDVIREFVYGRFPLAKHHAVQDDDSLIEKGIIDSLGVLDMVLFIENRFEIMLSDEEVVGQTFESIASLAAFVGRKLNGNGMHHSLE